MDLSFLQFLVDNPYVVIVSDFPDTLTTITNKITENSPLSEYGIVSNTNESALLYKEQINNKNQVKFCGTYYEAFLLLLNNELKADVLLFPSSSMNPENQAESHFFLHLWNHKVHNESAPRLLFLYRNPSVGDKIGGNMVLKYPSSAKVLTYYDEDFTQEYLKDELREKIEKIGALYPHSILTIVPSNAYKKQLSSLLTDPRYEFYTEDVARALSFSSPSPSPSTAKEEGKEGYGKNKYSAVIDLCMRKVSYTSVGGGIRTLDEIVGDDYTSDVDSIVKSIMLKQKEIVPLYRFINHEAHCKLRMGMLPYVNHYLFQLQKNGIPYNETNSFFPMITKTEGKEEYNSIVGPFSNAVLSSSLTSLHKDKDKGKEGITSLLIVLALIDSLDLFILDYGRQEQDVNMFKEYFSEFKGNDALDFFINVWNAYVSYYKKDGGQSFSGWASANRFNYTKMVEFYNTLYSLSHHLTGKGIQVEGISSEEKEKIKNIFYTLLKDKELTFVEQRSYASIYKNDLDEEFKVFNLLQINSSHPTIYPLAQDGRTVCSFMTM